MSTAAPSTFDPDPVPLERDVRLDSAYAQLQASPLEALSLTAGVRRDDHDEFGGNTTASASVAWSVAETTILRASYGEGFKAPTLYQLYSEFGNAALQPEDGEGWDAGIERRFLGGALVLVGTYFERDTINMIDFVSCFLNPDPRCGSRPFGFYDNVQRTEASGVELSMVASLGERMRLGANYTHLDAENSARGTANFGRELPRRPQEVANAELTYAWPFGLESTVAVQYVGSSFDNASNTAVLDEYTLIDLRIAYELSEQIQLYGRLENAFDEDYETTARYGAVGRGAFAGVRVRF